MRKTINGTEHKDCGGKHGCGKWFPATEEYFTSCKSYYQNKFYERVQYITLSTNCIPCWRKQAAKRDKKRVDKVMRQTKGLSWDYASAVHITRDWQVVRLGA